MSNILINSVFHPSDFSEGDQAAFQHALKLLLAAEADLCLLHVKTGEVKTYWGDFPHIRKTLEGWGMLPKGDKEIRLSDVGLNAFNVSVSEGDPVASILHYLRRHCFDLVVLATHQRTGFDRWMHAALAEPIARQSGEITLFVPRQCKGFVAAENGELSLRRVLIPVDAAPHPQRGVDAATALAEALGIDQLEMTTLHVGDEDCQPDYVLPQREGWKSERRTVSEGDCVDQILREARELSADLIVMTTEGRKGFLDSLRGDTTERVLRESPCPLLAIPAARAEEHLL